VRLAYSRTDLIDQQIIVDSLMWNKHKSKVHSIFRWANILRRLLNAHLEVVDKCLFKLLFFGRIFLFHELIIIFERKLRINRNNFVFYKNCSINYLAIFESVLHLILPRRQNVLEQSFEI